MAARTATLAQVNAFASVPRMTEPKRSALGTKLTKAREKRGWSIHAACAQTENVKYESLARLENGRTVGDRVPLRTVMELIHLYWPDMNLSDFVSARTLKKYKAEWNG